MIEAALYTISVFVALGVRIVWPEPYVPELALGFILPLILINKLREALLLSIMIVIIYSIFSATSWWIIAIVYGGWAGVMILAQHIFDQMWLVQAVIASLILALIQYVVLAQATLSALPLIMIQAGANLVWFLIMVYWSHSQQWYETLFE